MTPSSLLAGDVHRDREHASGGDDDRVVALAELVDRDVATDLDVEMELHPVARDVRDVELDDVTRQPERRHADEGRAAAGRQRLVDVDLVPVGGEILRGGQPGGPGADDRDALPGGGAHADRVRHVVAVVPVDEEALHGADGERLVDVRATTRLLARGAADVAADGRDRVRVARQDVPLLEPPLGGEHQVAAAVRVDRAAFLALDVALQPVDAHLGGLEAERDRVVTDHSDIRAADRLRFPAEANVEHDLVGANERQTDATRRGATSARPGAAGLLIRR